MCRKKRNSSELAPSSGSFDPNWAPAELSAQAADGASRSRSEVTQHTYLARNASADGTQHSNCEKKAKGKGNILNFFSRIFRKKPQKVPASVRSKSHHVPPPSKGKAKKKTAAAAVAAAPPPPPPLRDSTTAGTLVSRTTGVTATGPDGTDSPLTMATQRQSLCLSRDPPTESTFQATSNTQPLTEITEVFFPGYKIIGGGGAKEEFLLDRPKPSKLAKHTRAKR